MTVSEPLRGATKFPKLQVLNCVWTMKDPEDAMQENSITSDQCVSKTQRPPPGPDDRSQVPAGDQVLRDRSAVNTPGLHRNARVARVWL